VNPHKIGPELKKLKVGLVQKNRTNAVQLQATSKVIMTIKLWRLSQRAQPIKIIPFDHRLIKL